MSYMLVLAGARITKLDADHCHISNILATKGLLWLGTSLGITLVYRIPCLEGVPLISGRPYLAYDAHQDSVHVLLSMSVMMHSVRQRIGSRVLREHVRRMNRPISSTILEDPVSRDSTVSPVSDLSLSENVMCNDNLSMNNEKDERFPDNLSKESKDRIAQVVIDDLTSHDKVEPKSYKHKPKDHDYETLNWIGPDAQDQLTELTASQEGTSQQQQSCSVSPPLERQGSGEYETVEYPEDGRVVDVHNNLYTPMHPRHYSMSIPGKDETIAPRDEEIQLVVTAGRGLTHFRKLRSRTVYQSRQTPATVVKKTSHDGYLIVYELDSTLRMFNPEEEGNN